MSVNIGIGIVTCDRPDFFAKCVASVPDGVGRVVVVNDGTPYDDGVYPSTVDEVIQHPANRSVGVAKNDALRYLLARGCDYLFLVEDDTEILRPDVFEAYIRAAEISGLWHLNFGPGSPFNRIQARSGFDLHNRGEMTTHTPPNPRLVVSYADDVRIALYQHAVGMFSFFGRRILEQVGLHDEAYRNAWEHVDLTYRIIKAGLHPPFWYFADLWDSSRYLGEVAGAIEQSVIARDRTAWLANVEAGREHYRAVHGHYPNQVRDATRDELFGALRGLQGTYGSAGRRVAAPTAAGGAS